MQVIIPGTWYLSEGLLLYCFAVSEKYTLNLAPRGSIWPRAAILGGWHFGWLANPYTRLQILHNSGYSSYLAHQFDSYSRYSPASACNQIISYEL